MAEAAKAVGWAWPSPRVFKNRAGQLVDLDEVGPRDVESLFLRDSDAALWKLWAAKEGEGLGIE